MKKIQYFHKLSETKTMKTRKGASEFRLQTTKGLIKKTKPDGKTKSHLLHQNRTKHHNPTLPSPQNPTKTGSKSGEYGAGKRSILLGSDRRRSRNKRLMRVKYII